MSAELILRPYQLAAIDGLRQGARSGHRSQIVVAPTGAGKTALATQMMRDAAAKGSRVAFVVDRVALVDQTSAVLDRYGIAHGVIQAGHWRNRAYEKIQICSAQTLEKRGFFPNLNLLIVDECHGIRKETASLIQNRPELHVLGLTATPFTKGLSNLYTNLVNVSTTDALIGEGYLVPLKIYAAVSPDMAGAKVVAGEWTDADIEARGSTIIGDIVAEWTAKTLEHFGKPVKTIVFAASVSHGEALCRQFNAAGHRFVQISYRDGSDDRRRAIIEEFRKPESSIVGLVACEIFTKGFDVPDVMCGIAARPYRKSLSSHIQQMGRVMRPHPGKTFGLWLDHAGNALRFYEDQQRVFAEGVQSIENSELDATARKEPDEKVREKAKCSACSFVLPAYAEVCPACGHERKRRTLVETEPGQMIQIGARQVEATGKYEYLADQGKVWRQLAYIAMDRKRGDIDRAQRFAQAQFHAIYGTFYKKHVRNTEPLPPTAQLHGLIERNVIRWAKGRQNVPRQQAEPPLDPKAAQHMREIAHA